MTVLPPNRSSWPRYVATQSPAYVLDASAVLAWLHREPGGETVFGLMPMSAISTVNWSEVAEKAIDRGFDLETLQLDIAAFRLALLNFGRVEADIAARLRPLVRHAGLSLADRACLAHAIHLNVPAVTTDKSWGGLNIGVEIQLIR